MQNYLHFAENTNLTTIPKLLSRSDEKEDILRVTHIRTHRKAFLSS